jgi:flagella basal body P-ring formation protein FlgA
MKRFILYIVGSFLLLLSCFAEAIEFRHSMNRLVAPVTLDQIIKSDDNSDKTFKRIVWPSHMNGWVSQKQMNDFLIQHIGSAPYNWRGVSRVWIEQCYKPDINKINKIGKSLIKQQVENNGFILDRVSDLNYSKLPCLKQPITTFKVTQLVMISPKRAKADFEFILEDGSKIAEVIDWELRVQINALFLTRKSRKHRPLDSLELTTKTVTWTGKELNAEYNLSDRRLSRKLSANTVMKSNYIEFTPDISAGNTLRVNLEYGAVKIETSGKAITSGNTGQMIKVQIEGTNKIREAKVINKGVVNVSV